MANSVNISCLSEWEWDTNAAILDLQLTLSRSNLAMVSSREICIMVDKAKDNSNLPW